VGEHRIGQTVTGVFHPLNDRAGLFHKAREICILRDRLLAIEGRAVMPFGRIGLKQALAGAAHQHAGKRTGHCLGTEGIHYLLHAWVAGRLHPAFVTESGLYT
jgi:hypothetical protein